MGRLEKVVFAGLAALAVTACITPTGKPASAAENPECPHSWTGVGQGGGQNSSTIPAPIRIQFPRRSTITGNVLPAVTLTYNGGTTGAATAAPIPSTGLAIAPLTTDVPEFHDCQRLRVPYVTPIAIAPIGGTPSSPAPLSTTAIATVPPDSMVYGPLAGVFARDSLDSVTDSALAAGTVLGLVYLPNGGSYSPLGLSTAFHCLHVTRGAGTATAKMVAVGDQEGLCKSGLTAAQIAAGTSLAVRLRPPASGLSAADIPPVARWDWDAETSTQFINIRCGDAVCEIGALAGFGDSPLYSAATMSANQKKLFEFKGWYDEQHLAEYAPATGATPPGLFTSRNIGTVVPAAQLTPFNAGEAMEMSWVPVATVHTRDAAGSYASSFNFTPSTASPPDGAHSELYICTGSIWRCRPDAFIRWFKPSACDPDPNGVRWYAKVKREGHKTRYFCVIFRPHSGAFKIPPVTRWRWRLTDETIWVSCPAGCCEVNGDG